MSVDIQASLRLKRRRLYACTSSFIEQNAPLDPVYLFCPERLTERARFFRDHFPGTVSYAVKANPEPLILQTLMAAGIQHFDVASLAEIRAVLDLCPDAQLHYNNPIKDVHALEEAYHGYGVRSFALDEVSELDKIRAATAGDTSVTYTVRFKLPHSDAAYDFGSKFGAGIEEAVQLLRFVDALGARPALTFHPGSQCTDPLMYGRYLEAAREIIDRSAVRPAFINVGGGFPEQYPGQKVPSLGEYFRTIGHAADQYFPDGMELMCEPGRAMVATCVSLLARVIHVRDSGRSVFLNDGVYGGLQEQSITDFQLPTCVWRGGKRLLGPCNTHQLFGPTCDPVDRMQREVALPASLRKGDYIEFGLLGAYGSVTSTTFNGFRSSRYEQVENGTPFNAESQLIL